MIGKLVLLPLGIALLLVLLVTLVLAARQESLLFFPDRALRLEPEALGLPAETLALRASDATVLHGWWIRGGGRATILVFHGNAGNASDRLDRVKRLVDALHVDVLLADYRGYGRSKGAPSEKGLGLDGLAMYEAAAARSVSPERIVLFGESLGCAVAIETALERPCAGVILEAPFVSVPAMARHHYPWIPSFLVRLRFDNGEKIARLAGPKLISQAEHDEIVPPDQTRRVFDLAAPPKTYFVIPGASHNDTYLAGGRSYLEAWRSFLDEAVPEGRT